jgi:hypothetical protein
VDTRASEHCHRERLAEEFGPAAGLQPRADRFREHLLAMSSERLTDARFRAALAVQASRLHGSQRLPDGCTTNQPHM